MTQEDIKKLRGLLAVAQEDKAFPWRWASGDVAECDFLEGTRIFLSSNYKNSQEHCLLIQEALRLLPDLLDVADPPIKAEEPRKFSAGDIVQLKSGGPSMTVVGGALGLQNWVTCMWFGDEEKPHKAVFPLAGVR